MDALPSSPILVDQVYERLMNAITERRLRPGERIRQGQLAASLGVSRQPVSHALQVLKRQGLLRESGRQGLEVVPMDADRISHLFKARACLDGLAARLAAERCAAGRISAQEIASLEALLERGSSLGDEAPLSERVQADVEFHHRIHVLSGNPIIPELLEPQLPHLRRSMMAVFDDRAYRQRAWDEHADIARHVFAGDEAEAERAAIAHIMIAGEETTRRMRSTA